MFRQFGFINYKIADPKSQLKIKGKTNSIDNFDRNEFNNV